MLSGLELYPRWVPLHGGTKSLIRRYRLMNSFSITSFSYTHILSSVCIILIIVTVKYWANKIPIHSCPISLAFNLKQLNYLNVI